MVKIPLVDYLDKLYINLLPDETLLVVQSFHIENSIMEVHNPGPYFLLTGVSFDIWQWVKIVH